MTQTDKANAMFQDGPSWTEAQAFGPAPSADSPIDWEKVILNALMRCVNCHHEWICHDPIPEGSQPDCPNCHFGMREGRTIAPPVTFETGAIRHSTGKGLPFCVPPSVMRALWKHFEDGAEAHGLHNWIKGIPLSCYQNSISRHTLDAAEGGPDTLQHITAIMWNAACWYWTEEQISAGNLPKSLDDLVFRPNRESGEPRNGQNSPPMTAE